MLPKRGVVGRLVERRSLRGAARYGRKRPSVSVLRRRSPRHPELRFDGPDEDDGAGDRAGGREHHHGHEECARRQSLCARCCGLLTHPRRLVPANRPAVLLFPRPRPVPAYPARPRPMFAIDSDDANKPCLVERRTGRAHVGEWTSRQPSPLHLLDREALLLEQPADAGRPGQMSGDGPVDPEGNGGTSSSPATPRKT